jgi:homoaconitase/3-isopropylmalate dehydratase large subunit
MGLINEDHRWRESYFATLNDAVLSDAIRPDDEEYREVIVHRALATLHADIASPSAFMLLRLMGSSVFLPQPCPEVTRML